MNAIVNTMTDEQLLEKITQIVASQLEPIKTTQQEHTTILNKHSDILEEYSQILGEHTKDLKSLKAKVNKIDKTLNIVIKNFDGRIVANRKSIERIEDHLRLNLKH